MESATTKTPQKTTLQSSEPRMTDAHRYSDQTKEKNQLKFDILDDLHFAEQSINRDSQKGKPRQIVIKKNPDRLSLQNKKCRESDSKILLNRSIDDETVPDIEGQDDLTEFLASATDSSQNQDASSNLNNTASPFVSDFNADMPKIDLTRNDLKVDQSPKKRRESQTEFQQLGLTKFKSMNEENHSNQVNRLSEGKRNFYEGKEKSSFRIKSISRESVRSTFSREGSVSFDTVGRNSKTKTQREKSIHIPLAETHTREIEQIESRPRSNALFLKPITMNEEQECNEKSVVQKENLPDIRKSHQKSHQRDAKSVSSQLTKKNSQQESIDSTIKKRNIQYRHYVFSKKLPEEKFFLNFLQEMKDDLQFIKSLTVPNAPHLTYSLKRFDPSKKILMLDLDETLITTETQNERQQLRVLVRPYAREFIKHCSKHWNLALFTASTRKYAESIVQRLDPDGSALLDIISREFCIQHGLNFVKDLRVVTQVAPSLANVLLIDNKLAAFAFQPFNGLPILPFKGDPNDQELKDLTQVLQELANPTASITEWIASRYNHDSLFSLHAHVS